MTQTNDSTLSWYRHCGRDRLRKTIPAGGPNIGEGSGLIAEIV